MWTPYSFFIVISAVLGLILAIPSNTCIVMGNLDSIRKKEKLRPTDVIFLGKGMVNIPLQCVLSLHGMLFAFTKEILYIKQVYTFMNISAYFLTYYNFWLTFWLSAHYCTSITNLSYGFFIWLKRIVSNYLSQVLFMTALGVSIVSVPTIWSVHAESPLHFFENSTEASVVRLRASLSYTVSSNTLGVVLPFCLSLLCLVLTSSFLLRHVWRVKNNDSGSTRPNLQVHVTALRTIFFLLLMSTFFCITRVLLCFRTFTELLDMVNWSLRILSPSVEAAIILQASNKLRRFILRRFWTRSWRSTET